MADLIESVLEACVILSEDQDALETAQRLGTVLSNSYGRIKLARDGWEEAEILVSQNRADRISHVDLIPVERPTLASLEARFGPSKYAGQINPFQPPRVSFWFTPPGRKIQIHISASLHRDENRRPDGTVSKVMLIPR